MHRHPVPRTDVTVLDQRQPLRLKKRSPRRRELGRCRNSSTPEATTVPSPMPAFWGSSSAGVSRSTPSRLAPLAAGIALSRQLDRELGETGQSEAVVRGGAHGRLLMGDTSSESNPGKCLLHT
jgi:hypothetical protein